MGRVRGPDEIRGQLERLVGGPITDPNEIAVIQEHTDPDAVDRACDLDRAYFEQHPAAESYERDQVQGEFPPARLPAPPPGFRWQVRIEVTQLAPGLRVRRATWAALVEDE